MPVGLPMDRARIALRLRPILPRSTAPPMMILPTLLLRRPSLVRPATEGISLSSA